MAKQINYLLIARELTGDSELLFFDTLEQAKAEYSERTQEIFNSDETLEEGVDFEYDTHWKLLRGQDEAITFKGSDSEKLSALLNYIDHYFLVGCQEVEDDCTHYLADFSEHLDLSHVTFFNKEDAFTQYNKLVEDGIKMQNDYSRNTDNVLRDDKSTWEDDKFGTLFGEGVNDDGSTEAFFGFSDVYWIYRVGEIKIKKI